MTDVTDVDSNQATQRSMTPQPMGTRTTCSACGAAVPATAEEREGKLEMVFPCLVCGHENTFMDPKIMRVLTHFVDMIKFGDVAQRAWFDLARDQFIANGSVPQSPSDELERCCEYVIAHSLPTGPAESFTQLIQEVVAQHEKVSTRWVNARKIMGKVAKELEDEPEFPEEARMLREAQELNPNG